MMMVVVILVVGGRRGEGGEGLGGNGGGGGDPLDQMRDVCRALVSKLQLTILEEEDRGEGSNNQEIRHI